MSPTLPAAELPRMPLDRMPLDQRVDTARAKRVRAVAEDLEAVFLAQMLAPMFQALKTDGLFGGGPGEDIYRSMLVEEYGKTIARAGGVGIAEAVQREILRLQEVRLP